MDSLSVVIPVGFLCACALSVPVICRFLGVYETMQAVADELGLSYRGPLEEPPEGTAGGAVRSFLRIFEPRRLVGTVAGLQDIAASLPPRGSPRPWSSRQNPYAGRSGAPSGTRISTAGCSTSYTPSSLANIPPQVVLARPALRGEPEAQATSPVSLFFFTKPPNFACPASEPCPSTGL